MVGAERGTVGIGREEQYCQMRGLPNARPVGKISNRANVLVFGTLRNARPFLETARKTASDGGGVNVGFCHIRSFQVKQTFRRKQNAAPVGFRGALGRKPWDPDRSASAPRTRNQEDPQSDFVYNFFVF